MISILYLLRRSLSSSKGIPKGIPILIQPLAPLAVINILLSHPNIRDLKVQCGDPVFKHWKDGIFTNTKIWNYRYALACIYTPPKTLLSKK
jgi:hypothetical protein